jgi:hypothetical protein
MRLSFFAHHSDSTFPQLPPVLNANELREENPLFTLRHWEVSLNISNMKKSNKNGAVIHWEIK